MGTGLFLPSGSQFFGFAFTTIDFIATNFEGRSSNFGFTFLTNENVFYLSSVGFWEFYHYKSLLRKYLG